MLSRNLAFTWLITISAIAQGAPEARITCYEEGKTEWSVEEGKLRDLLWEEVISYLDAYQATLQKNNEFCRTVNGTTATKIDGGQSENKCLDYYHDISLMIDQVKTVVDNADTAKKCFDPTMTALGAELRGYSPSDELTGTSAVAGWLNRPTFRDAYPAIDSILDHLDDFGDEFLEILLHSESSSQWTKDATIHGLPNLWASAPWIPMYMDEEFAGNHRFRGGYAYAEIMGPWGMLRVDEIDGVAFQAEIGITNQRSGTFYPGHFHYQQELYVTLTKPSCEGQNQFLLLDENSDSFKLPDWSPYYMDMDHEDNWVLYIERNDLHSFIAGDCQDPGLKSGLVTAWARTIVREGLNQTTGLCRTIDAAPENIKPGNDFECDIPPSTP